MKPSYPHNRVWKPAHRSNYSPGANRPERIIIHVVQGSWTSALNWFQNPSANVSAHWTIASDGSVGQSLGDYAAGWHAGNWWWNSHSLGIEHGGYINQPRYFTDAMLHASARLVAYKCKQYNIPVDRKHIVAHSQIPGTSHTDPGAHWPWARYMALVKQYRFGRTPAPKPAPSSPAPTKGVEEQEVEYRRVNTLAIGSKNQRVGKAAVDALNEVGKARANETLFARRIEPAGAIRFVSRMSAEAAKGQVISLVIGTQTKAHLSEKVDVIGTLDKTDILDCMGDSMSHTVDMVSWRLSAIADYLGFSSGYAGSEKDKLLAAYGRDTRNLT